MQTISETLKCRSFFISKSNALYFFPIQNRTRCKIFKSKPDALYFFLFENLLFKSSFQILAETISKCYQHHRTTCWILTTTWSKKIFYECVACVCLTFGTIFLVIAFLTAIKFLMVVMTISFALSFDLYKSFWISEIG